jgi:hypothetical protein
MDTVARRWYDQRWSVDVMWLRREESIGSLSIVLIASLAITPDLGVTGRGAYRARRRGHFPESSTWAHPRGSVIGGHVQGVIAEYERAKFLERSRRGKRHAAQEGRVGILCHAPYGYRYVNKQEGGGEARFEIVFDEARIVQQVYTWVGQERCTSNEGCRRLHQAGVQRRTGKEYWDHKTIWDRLKNPAYKGEAAFGKTRLRYQMVRVCACHEESQPNRDDRCGEKMPAIRRMDYHPSSCPG